MTTIKNNNISYAVPTFDVDISFYKEKNYHPDILLSYPIQFIVFFKNLIKKLKINYDYVNFKNNSIEFQNIFERPKNLILENILHFDDSNKKIMISFNTQNFNDDDYNFIVSIMENILGHKIYTKRKYENYPHFDIILSRYYLFDIKLR
ncbi:hypothetical protein ma360 [Moumouvirus australiensis]|uniref:Uncharacterized protein n=1 Tax=Moumouvirus australiensis TaxID=2109587 RepID=A0A2P1ELH1_9VIRU|nr:hypothetical protein QKC55_gp545 [Moumouvirus australiensis]AVL94746.1 hypothetical protein ma360 [Moumouvirus australiensis]